MKSFVPGFQGKIVAVCRSTEKGVPKADIGKGMLLAGLGLERDAHAGGWHRQISLLSVQSIDKMRAKGLELKWGDFAENLTIEGIDLPRLPVGTRFSIGAEGGPVLEVTQIGKECHHGCAIFQQIGECVMPKEGIFARVIKGGSVSNGDDVREFDPRRFVVATVTASDRGASGEREDMSGRMIADMVSAAGGQVVSAGVLSDDRGLLKQELLRLCDDVGVDIVLTTGGTGLGPRDVTPDATQDILQKEVPGIAEAMRAASMKKTSRAMLSRAVAGIRGSTLVVNLPGSPKAVQECLEVIMPGVIHGIETMKSFVEDCARS